MLALRIGVASLVVLFSAGISWGQMVGIGGTTGGTIQQNSAAIAKYVSAHAGIQMRTQPMGGMQQMIPAVNSGRLEFALGDAMTVIMADSGTGLSEGKKYDNLALAVTMMVYRTALIVGNDSGIRRMADLKGKRVPYGFNADPMFQIWYTGFLANAGLTWDDVTRVPTLGLRHQWDHLKQGKVDVAFGGPGAGFVKDLNASISGGVRFISFENATAGAKTMLAQLPSAYYMRVDPLPQYVAVPEPITLMAYDLLLYTNKSVSDDVVYRVVKVMHDYADELKTLTPIWASYDAKRMAKDQRMAYHAGAERFYKEVGIWKR